SNHDYVVFRKDRPSTAEHSRGGGVAILSSPLLNPFLVNTFSCDGIESVIIDIHHSSYCHSLPFKSVRICMVYRSPSCTSASLVSFLSFIEPLINNSPFLLCGDFNFPTIDWTNLTSPSKNDLLPFASDHHMTQFVNFKMRGENILDLVLCNRNLVFNVKPSLPFSDHSSISFSLGIPPPPAHDFVPSRKYHLADWDSINHVISLRAHFVRVESRVIESKNPKAYYNLCKSRLKSSSTSPPGILDVDGTKLLTNLDKAQAFSKYFASVSSSPHHAPLLPHTHSQSPSKFDLPSISAAQILVAIRSLSPKCNVSPDNLGILMHPSLKFNEHITKITSKARAQVNIMFKCFYSTDHCLYNRAFVTFIRPLLEYCSVVWSPSTVTLANSIESVQRNFTRRLFARCNIPYTSYPQRISFLSLQTLEHRRLISDFLFLYKSIHGFYSYDHSSLYKISPLTRSLRRAHALRISLPFAPPKSHSSFVTRTVDRLNALSSEIATSSPKRFRSHLLSLPSISFSSESLLRL
ncbi:hypothetical protein PMAYCL1PPCAC_18174, partial [Pristionchus mayeri]